MSENVLGEQVHTRVRPGRSEEGRLEILVAATNAFMELGYARASIDEIADQLGATKGRVYHYYRSKADILLDIHRHVLDMMTREVKPLSEGGSSAEALHAMAERHVALILENLAFTRVALLSTTDLFVNAQQRGFVREISEVRAGYEGMFVSVIERGIAAGEFREGNARLFAKALLGSLNWTTMWYSPRPDETEATRRQLASSVADFVTGGVRR